MRRVPARLADGVAGLVGKCVTASRYVAVRALILRGVDISPAYDRMPRAMVPDREKRARRTCVGVCAGRLLRTPR